MANKKIKTTDLSTVGNEYIELMGRLKTHIVTAQTRVAKAVNTQLVELYWNIGHEILKQQKASGWGNNVYGRIADDLRAEMGSIRGFSRRNLTYMCQFARLWPELQFVQALPGQIESGQTSFAQPLVAQMKKEGESEFVHSLSGQTEASQLTFAHSMSAQMDNDRKSEFVPPVVAQIGWTQNILLMDEFGDDQQTYLWYAQQSILQGWSKRHLETQIALALHTRQGSAITNFQESLEPAEAQAVSQLIKDPYIFDFLSLDDNIKERQLEEALLTDIQKLLLELGTGFSFYGRQKSLMVGEEEFFLDLIFYHHTLRRFIVIELKAGKFKPEYAGKMNFYLNAVDMFINVEGDKESIGIILCSDHADTTATISLSRIQSPIAISNWKTIAKNDPDELKALEQIEEVKQKLVDRINARMSEIEPKKSEIQQINE